MVSLVLLRVLEGCWHENQRVSFFSFSLKLMMNVLNSSPQLTIATAVVFCHKFFANHSHKQRGNERFVLHFQFRFLHFIQVCFQVIATACLFLAGKVEETPKALRDVVKTALLIKYQDDPNRYNKLINDRVCS
jgi:cyclin T